MVEMLFFNAFTIVKDQKVDVPLKALSDKFKSDIILETDYFQLGFLYT